MIVFLHIPKTAGSTMRSLLFSQYKKKNLFFVNSENPSESLDKLKSVNTPLELIYGHIDVGYVDSSISNRFKYITVLRDPVDRIVSHYYYIKKTKRHYLHNEIVKNNISLKDYVQNGYSKELNDGQVRMIIGAGGHHKNEFSKYDIAYGATEHWMLNKALSNIKNEFIFIGLQEQFKESVFLLKKKLNWKTRIFFESKNKNTKRLKVSEIDAETLSVIKTFNKLDIQLYEKVKINFQSEIKKNIFYLLKESIMLSLLKIKRNMFN